MRSILLVPDIPISGSLAAGIEREYEKEYNNYERTSFISQAKLNFFAITAYMFAEKRFEIVNSCILIVPAMAKLARYAG
ncbi:MAG TPA: hypothetical protein P5239_03805 [Victivallales bacterium]|nr:hypothetical protein [Victivallales bacterium]HRU00804.1 hypothetical protein [Victivallales bacterium]